MLTKIAVYSLATTVSLSSILTATHFASHAYVAQEAKVTSFLEQKLTRLKASVSLYTGRKDPTPMVTPTLEELADREAKEQGLNPNLLRALIEIESGWKVDAERFEPQLNTRSIGLTQVLASNAGRGPCRHITWSELYQASPNLKCGTAILTDALRKHKTLYKALIAYNGGDSCSTRVTCHERASDYAGKVIMRFAESVKAFD